MIRMLLFALLIVVLYQAVRTIVRSAISAYGQGDSPRQRSDRLPGEEMVLDPQCRTYVVKDRAVARRVNGSTIYFCSSACADEYAHGRRS